MDMNYIAIKELALLGIAILTLSGMLGSVIFFALRTKFVTLTVCKDSQNDCHSQVCRKITELRDEIKGISVAQSINQELSHRQNIWIHGALVKIATELKTEIPDMPTRRIGD